VCISERNGCSRVRTLKPSGRGEFEITDVNNSYLPKEAELDGIEGGWTDAGTFESLWRATKMVREKVLIARIEAVRGVGEVKRERVSRSCSARRILIHLRALDYHL